MNAGELKIKERILLTGMEYSVLEEKMKDDECGWSEHSIPGKCWNWRVETDRRAG
jgi:hypothetical protein